MSRSIRFFDIIQILRRTKAPVTAQRIAETLEVTKRTIYRDIASLQASGLPIHGEAGIGYIMRSGYDLPPLMFEPEELEAITVGLTLLGRTGDPGLEHAAQCAATKISEILPERATAGAPLHVSTWNQIPEVNTNLGELRRFIRQATQLRIEYLDRDGQQTTRTICPIALIYYIDAVVLGAWCEMRQAFRHFRADRIQKCTSTGQSFPDTTKTLRQAWQKENAAGMYPTASSIIL